MYSGKTVDRALALLAAGHTVSSVSRELDISRGTLLQWRRGDPSAATRRQCPRCDEVALDQPSYAALLGFYLGDGCLSPAARYVAFRVSCDARYPGVVDDVRRLMDTVHPETKVFLVAAPGVTVVQSHWKHWPCLFPQHGPCRKHERRIRLEPWQQTVVGAHAADLLRGLFHSDGSRTNNWATRIVAGQRKRYDYPRWEFVNISDDIIDICAAALDALGLHWTRPRSNAVSVARAADVRRLDDAIGLKA